MPRPLPVLQQSPTEPGFVQDPYGFYERARTRGRLFWWQEYGMPCALSHAAVSQILRDRRFGREPPAGARPEPPDHLKPFFAVEDHSMLELEGPRHGRLRGLVLRAFTSARIAAMAGEIETLCHDLLDAVPEGDVIDLLEHYARLLPMIVVSRLLGVPEAMAPRLLVWSSAMVAMYQARRDRPLEEAAARAAAEFSGLLRDLAEERRRRPLDDLISALVAAESEGGRLSPEELVATCILLLNAAHEATVHTLGNGVHLLLRHATPPEFLAPDRIEATVEEILRFDPPMHLFARHVYEEAEVMGFRFQPGARVACLLAAANRDPAAWDDPGVFDPSRLPRTHHAFGAGAHFCLGAPLARLELRIALRVLFSRWPEMQLHGRPRYADLYHFHGLSALPVRPGRRRPRG